MVSVEMDAAQDFRRARSLLSTNSCDSQEQKAAPHPYTNPTSHSSMLQLTQALPHASSHHWQTEQQSTNSRVHVLSSQNNGGVHFQDFQLLRPPYNFGFYSSQFDWHSKPLIGFNRFQTNRPHTYSGELSSLTVYSHCLSGIRLSQVVSRTFKSIHAERPMWFMGVDFKAKTFFFSFFFQTFWNCEYYGKHLAAWLSI